jgi:hypothetical protein
MGSENNLGDGLQPVQKHSMRQEINGDKAFLFSQLFMLNCREL